MAAVAPRTPPSGCSRDLGGRARTHRSGRPGQLLRARRHSLRAVRVFQRTPGRRARRRPWSPCSATTPSSSSRPTRHRTGEALHDHRSAPVSRRDQRPTDQRPTAPSAHAPAAPGPAAPSTSSTRTNSARRQWEGCRLQPLALTRRAEALGKWGGPGGDDLVALPGSELAGWFTPADRARFFATWNHLDRDELVTGGVVRERRYGRLAASRGPGGAVELHTAAAPGLPADGGAHPAVRGTGQDRSADPGRDAGRPGPHRTDLRRPGGRRAVVPEASRFEVGLHQIRVLATPDAPGRPTPEGRHRDGHDFIGMHLIGRVNCAAASRSSTAKDSRRPG